MPDFNFDLGLLQRLACYLLLLVEMTVAALAFRRPPRHAILLLPLALALIFVACLGPLAILAARAHDPTFDTLNMLSVVAIVGLAVVLAYRPNRMAFAVAFCILAFLVIRYVLAFMAPFHGKYALAVTLLKDPYWICVLTGEIMQLSAATAYASLAVLRPDVFKRA